MKIFDPDKPYIKVRGMGTIHYEQDGCKFNSGHNYIGKLNEPAPSAEKIEADKKDVRSSARAKISGKRKKKSEKPSLEGFRHPETPTAVKGAAQENEAARQAEDNA